MAHRRNGAVTVVPWMSSQEFHWVKASLFSDDNERLRDAYERLLVWQARLGTKTPIAIECTINLFEAKLANNGHLKESHLTKLFSLALVRSISLITYSMQSGGVLTPMQVLARQSGIPEWIVQFRHDTSHSVGSPPFSLAKNGVLFMISWLKGNFWDVYIPPASTLDEPLDYSAEDDIRDLLLLFQQQQFQTYLSGKGPAKKLNRTLDKLTSRLETEDSRNTLCAILIQDGFLIPTKKQLAALRISVPPTEDLISVQEFPSLSHGILQFWQPMVAIVARSKKITHLMVALVTRLGRLSESEQNITAYLILGWINAICSTVFRLNEPKYSGFLSFFEISRNVSEAAWFSVIVACVAEVNRCTQVALKILLQTAGKNFPDSTKENLLELVSLTLDSSDFGLDEDEMEAEEDLYGDEVFFDLLEERTSFEDQDLRQLRGQPCKAWCHAPESVNWGFYPVGVLPGQSPDPSYFNLLSKEVGRMNGASYTLIEKESLQNEARGCSTLKSRAASKPNHQNEEAVGSHVSLRLEPSLTVDKVDFL